MQRQDLVFIYFSPGKSHWRGIQGTFDSRTVERSEIEDWLAEGWAESPQEAIANAETRNSQDAQKEAGSMSDLEIYEMAASGKGWPEIKAESGNGAPHLAAKRYAKEAGLPYPPQQ